MDLEHLALAWCVRFAVQIISRVVKGADGLTAFQRVFQRVFHPRDMPSAWREQIVYLEARETSCVECTGQLIATFVPAVVVIVRQF